MTRCVCAQPSFLQCALGSHPHHWQGGGGVGGFEKFGGKLAWKFFFLPNPPRELFPLGRRKDENQDGLLVQFHLGCFLIVINNFIGSLGTSQSCVCVCFLISLSAFFSPLLSLSQKKVLLKNYPKLCVLARFGKMGRLS